MNKSSQSVKKLTPLGALADELRNSNPCDPITVAQARVLVASVVNVSNVLVRLVDIVDSNQDVANANVQNISQNFIDLFNCLQTVGAAVGIEIHGVNSGAVTATDAESGQEIDEPVPENVTKH